MLKQSIKSLLVVIFFFTVAVAQEKPEKEQKESVQQSEVKNVETTDTAALTRQIWNKVCPVKGNPVEEDSPTVEYNGKVYGFCCPGCDTKFAKNPEKYSKNLSEDGTKFIGKK